MSVVLYFRKAAKKMKLWKHFLMASRRLGKLKIPRVIQKVSVAMECESR